MNCSDSGFWLKLSYSCLKIMIFHRNFCIKYPLPLKTAFFMFFTMFLCQSWKFIPSILDMNVQLALQAIPGKNLQTCTNFHQKGKVIRLKINSFGMSCSCSNIIASKLYKRM